MLGSDEEATALTMKKRNDLLQQANERVSFLKQHMFSKHIVSGMDLREYSELCGQAWLHFSMAFVSGLTRLLNLGCMLSR